MTDTNPLNDFSTLKHRAVPFDKIQPGHFLPALKSAIEDAKSRIDEIATSSHEPTFEDTIEALETSSERLDSISHVFYNLLHAESNDDLQSISKEFAPLMSEFQNDVLLDKRLYDRVDSVYLKRSQLKLTPEQMQLLTNTHQDFTRNGASLHEDEKEQLREIDKELSTLGPQFQENVLKATNVFELWVTDSSDLKGLPDGAIQQAAVAAKKKAKRVSIYSLYRCHALFLF